MRPRSAKSILRDQKGQSALEFMICVLVVFFFLMFYLSLAILLVTSNYIDYATFMAARTYKSGYDTDQTKLANAQKVFNAYTNRVRGIADNIQLQLLPSIPGTNDRQTAGFTATYDINLFYLPPIFMLNDVPPSRIHLSAEAHLGSDPGLQDCTNYFGQFSSANGLNLDQGLLEELDDNGC